MTDLAYNVGKIKHEEVLGEGAGEVEEGLEETTRLGSGALAFGTC